MITISTIARANLICFKAIMNSRVLVSKLERYQFQIFYFEKKTLLAYGSREGFGFLSGAWRNSQGH